MTGQPIDEAYGEDVAWVHDAGFGDIARAAAQLVLEAVGPPPKIIVELGCGSGISSELLADAGHVVTGIDPSPAMLEIARRRAPAVSFTHGSWRTTAIPPCDVITAVGEVVNYLGPESPARVLPAIADLAARALEALRPGGLLLLDVAGPGRAPGGSSSGYRVGADWAIVMDAREDGMVLRRRLVAFRRRGESYRRADETHTLELVSPASVVRTLRELGYRVRLRRGYSEQTALPGHRVILARAPR